MNVIRKDTLICRDSKCKIRRVDLLVEWNEQFQMYIIHRSSGLIDGKQISHPNIEIKKGKVKRTITEQMNLEYNSLLKEYKDKGYKSISDLGYNNLSEFDPETVLPKEKRDQNNAIKPMLAKLIQSVPKSTLNSVTNWYISRKIDGTRSLLYINDGKINFSSRGGGDYNYPTSHIRNHPKLIEYFKSHPDIIMDGEIFVFGKSLQALNSCVRLEDGKIPFKVQYYVYDIVDVNKTFEERYKIIQSIKDELQLGFDPNKEFKDDELMIQILPQEKIPNDDKIMWSLHNKYVSEGWEGAVLRNPNKKYNPGARDMIKLKSRLDSEFKTIGYELGMRGVEDLVFKMETSDGKIFKAKPVGSREIKQDMFNHINDIIGQMATCTYFYLSDTGVPLQPVWKSVRLNKDV